MKFYGVDMQGPLKIQDVGVLPAYVSGVDDRRFIRTSDDKLYVGSDFLNKWSEVTTENTESDLTLVDYVNDGLMSSEDKIKLDALDQTVDGLITDFNTLDQTVDGLITDFNTLDQTVDGLIVTVGNIESAGDLDSYASVIGNGLSGGGILYSPVGPLGVSLGTPSTLNGNTTNTSGPGATHTHAISPASETLRGVIEIATIAEVLAGTDNFRAVTPYGVMQAIGSQNSLSGNGWYELPGGLILQWGQVNAIAGSTLVVFPISFASTCYHTSACPYTSDSANILNIMTRDATVSSFYIQTWTNYARTNAVRWFAIGV